MDYADHIARERLEHHGHRLVSAERKVSGFEKAIDDLGDRITRLEIPMRWITRLLAICTVGILSILGAMLAQAMGMHVR